MSWFVLWLACSWTAVDPSGPEPPSELDRARAALHTAERELLRSEALARLQAGQLEQAAAPLLAAERLGGFPDLNERALSLAEASDPGLAIQLHTALADAVRDDPARALEHHRQAVDRAAEAEIRARYASGIEPALARVNGVHRGMVEPALDLALQQHVHPPERAVLETAGRARLLALVRMAGLPDGAGASVDAAIEAGIPEPIAVSEFVEGALASLDVWTRIAWPAELGGWEAHHSGVTVGVGLELEPFEQGLRVSSLVPGSPAFSGGVHQGDRLVVVRDSAGRIEAAAGLEAVTAALVGEEGSELTLELEREGAPLSLRLTRAAVRRQTVHGWTRDETNAEVVAIEGHPGLGYLHIEAFRSYTDESVRDLLEGVGELTGLILDLRGNPGGDVQAAANLIDLFVGEGVAATLDGPGAPPPAAEGEVAWNALIPGDRWESLPLAVLIDRDSASAAEIAAGALGLREGVVSIGERTYGKGWSQGLELHPEYGFALQTTNAAWHLANGRPIQRIVGEGAWGVAPDVLLVESAAESWQNAAARAAREFPRTHADGTAMHPPDPGRREGLPVLGADPAVERAIRELAGARRSSR